LKVHICKGGTFCLILNLESEILSPDPFFMPVPADKENVFPAACTEAGPGHLLQGENDF
jgi:hypothetical protein